MARQPYVMSPSEVEILRAAAEDPDILCDYFLRPYGAARGFRFDENFDPEGAWQKTVHHASQSDIIVIGGFGTGKTLGIAMSAVTWCLTTPDFMFLNVAEKAWQAKQMYDAVIRMARNTPLENLIWEMPRRPYPKIVFKFRIGQVVIESSMEFMSADRDATGILSWEGDWINIEEAGLLDNLEEVVTSVGSRLRGQVKGRTRLGRLSMISNSWDNPYLWQYFDQALADPQNFLSLVVSTRHNHNVTEDQLKRMLARIPEDERQRFIDGTRPEGKGNYFAREKVYACEDRYYSEFLTERVAAGDPGYALSKVHGAGVVYFRVPPKAERIYMMFGDPGTGNLPFRNSPVIGVWDVTEFPNEAARLVAFWWGNGHGAISPFVAQFLELKELYNPIFAGMDSTGPQKNSAELLNLQYFSPESGERVIKIAPMDFSGPRKNAYLVSLRLLIEAQLLTWPKCVVGIRSQLTNYDFERDKKIPQDIVAMMGMAAYAFYTWFHVDPKTLAGTELAPVGLLDSRVCRLSGAERSRRSDIRAH